MAGAGEAGLSAFARSRGVSRGRFSRRRSEEHTSELQSPVHIVCRPASLTLLPYTTLFRSRPPLAASVGWAVSDVTNSGAIGRTSRLSQAKSAEDKVPAHGGCWRGGALCLRAVAGGEQGPLLAPQIGRAHV